MRHVLIADDHAVTRRGLRDLMREHFDNLDIVEVASADAVLEQVRAKPWDLILLDIRMPGPPTMQILAHIREVAPQVPVLVLTAVTEPEYALHAMRAGANGFIQKSRAAEDLLEAIRRVSDGGTYLHPEIVAALGSDLRDDGRLPHRRLSDRELEVFRLIAKGLAVKGIAGTLGLSEKTVATYLARIRDKTDLKTHVEITRYALRHGLVE